MSTQPAVGVEATAAALAVAGTEPVRRCAEECIDLLGEPTLIERPVTGTIDLQLREPVVRERFRLGDVVATRAEVDLAGRRGWAMRLGTDRVTTLAAAICAAAAEHDETAHLVAAVVSATHADADRRERELVDALRPTVVDFSELD